MAAKPAHTIRHGAIKVTIWMNEGEKGPWYSAVPSRSYKQAEEWKDSDSFGEDELLIVSKLLDMAHSWIMAERQTQPSQQAA